MAEHPLPEPWIHYNNGYTKKTDVVAALETEHLSGKTTLEMVASLGFCLEHKALEQVLNPSKLVQARLDEHWPHDTTMVVNAGRRLKCKGTVAIAHAFFPHLQVHFYHRYLTDYEERLPMWKGGIRLVAGKRTPAEALIEAHPANMSIDIIVRGRSGSEHACADLLQALTEETWQKAVDITPGSQLALFYLSRLELDKLSPAGMLSRPRVEYSVERVKQAIQKGEHITDGNASSPENPHDLLLSSQALDDFLLRDSVDAASSSLCGFAQVISAENWMVILLNIAQAVNSSAECVGLAKGLAVNDKGGDIVEQLRDVDPRRSPPDIANQIFQHWFKQTGGEKTTDWRRMALHRAFRKDVRRTDLCIILDDELRGHDGSNAADRIKSTS